MRRAPIRALAVLPVLFGLGLAACGDDGSDAAAGSGYVASDPAIEVTDVGTFTVTGLAAGDAERLRSIVAGRLADLHDSGIEGSEVVLSGDRLVVRLDASGADAAQRAFALLSRPGVLRVRPVISRIPGSLEALAATSTTVAGREVVPQLSYATPDQDLAGERVTLPSRVGSALDGAVLDTYRLGPAADGVALAASGDPARDPSGAWTLGLAPTAVDGIGAFNVAASSCYEHGEACPSGQLALVVDGTVLAAPAVSQPAYERDQLQISLAGADDGTVRELAALLSSGPLPATLAFEGSTGP